MARDGFPKAAGEDWEWWVVNQGSSTEKHRPTFGRGGRMECMRGMCVIREYFLFIDSALVKVKENHDIMGEQRAQAERLRQGISSSACT